MDQQELIVRLKKGDELAFKHIVETWQNMVYNTAIGIVQSAEDAEDIAQETFVQVYQSIHSFRNEAKLSTWIYRIVITKSLDHERKKKRKKRFAFVKSLFGEDEIHPPDFHHPGVVAEKKEQAGELFKALKQIPEKQRIAFTLHKLEGLSYQEVAEVLNTTLYATESLMQRAKNNLKRVLEKYYLENEK
ncbi:RNA polymerase sigma factor [Ferruginibacter albus]|uniref:RNA polymerase sigma factor n=1 Tax=Ferruginibacter albus TaxID=2875540 RepID=UPI001CC7046F|nr:RNA polymerase sigma factor [Ferruginibacter albus]UAY51945.1 RNA polymerase sigma factor [Ferruginibacter albus]